MVSLLNSTTSTHTIYLLLSLPNFPGFSPCNSIFVSEKNLCQNGFIPHSTGCWSLKRKGNRKERDWGETSGLPQDKYVVEIVKITYCIYNFKPRLENEGKERKMK